jgi:2-deoxy-D-gluconate 3-dehydrogenase
VTVLDQFRLDGRRALVTGGAGGLGTAMSEALADAGAQVAILGRSQNVDTVARTLSTRGGEVHAIRGDMADREQRTAAFARAVERLGAVDVLVLAHGYTRATAAIDHDLASWDETLETNVTSVFELAQLAARQMIPRGGGKIITIASMNSFFGGLNVAAYTASKGGVAQLTKALANEWASQRINVNSIAPGYIKTTLNQHLWRDNSEREQQILARLPVGRWGKPEDLKGATVFLASRASDYLHGVVLPVDGGYLAR